MKNNVVVDFDTNRNPPILIGKLNQIPLDSGGKAPQVADLETLLQAIIVQIRILEKNKFQIAPLLKSVVQMIEKGVFDANIEINIKPCKEK